MEKTKELMVTCDICVYMYMYMCMYMYMYLYCVHVHMHIVHLCVRVGHLPSPETFQMNVMAVQNRCHKCDLETGTIITEKKIIADNTDLTIIMFM